MQTWTFHFTRRLFFGAAAGTASPYAATPSQQTTYVTHTHTHTQTYLHL